MWHYIVLALGWIIKVIYELTLNYGVAIILFTIIIKSILLPLNIKSQKSMRKQQKIQPIVAELQKKYANDQAKLQQEMMKVYKDNNVSMAGGCLPMLIQMPIIIALYQAIRRPLTYMFNVPYKDVPAEILDKVNFLKDSMLEKFPEVVGNLANVDAANIIKESQIQLSDWAHRINGSGDPWFINFNFLGLDLSNTPWSAINYLSDIPNHLDVFALLIIPVLAVISSIVQTKVSTKMSGQDLNQNSNSQAAAMSKSMLWMMPVMTGYFTLVFPAGLGLYWIISGVVQIIQQFVLYYYFEKKGEEVVVKVPESKHNNRKKSKKRR